jgi:hypothetical protein
MADLARRRDRVTSRRSLARAHRLRCIAGMTASLRVVAILALAACSNPSDASSRGPGAAPPTETPAATKPAEPSLGDVAFKTFRDERGDVVAFLTKSQAEMTWPNMAGETVHGTFTQTGPEIEIHWDPKYTNNGSSIERYHQMDPCSMARYERVDRKTGKTVESTLIYQQARPRCDTVRLTK